MAIENNDFDASVGIHKMTDKIDEGRVMFEKNVIVKEGSVEEIYNQLYFYYAMVIMELLDFLDVEIAYMDR